MTLRGQLYAEFARGHGEMARIYLSQAAAPGNAWADYDYAHARKEAIEAAHFANLLTRAEIEEVLRGNAERIDWLRDLLLPTPEIEF